MRALGACFAEAIGVQLNLPTEGRRVHFLRGTPGALIVLALRACDGVHPFPISKPYY
jgi:hypothetical protein